MPGFENGGRPNPTLARVSSLGVAEIARGGGGGALTELDVSVAELAGADMVCASSCEGGLDEFAMS